MSLRGRPTQTEPVVRPGDEAYGGQEAYTPLVLMAYDLFVLRLSGRFVFGCPTTRMVRHYNAHVSSPHLDIGVGTGFFLDRCRFPTRSPSITLMDINANSLGKAARRIRRYAPSWHLGNVLEPIDLPHGSFGSVGMNWLLHCLPGNMESKSVVFENVRPLLADDGVLFGSTFLGRRGEHSRSGLSAIERANRLGYMTNLDDDVEGLRAGLARHFASHEVEVSGSVALFAARP